MNLKQWLKRKRVHSDNIVWALSRGFILAISLAFIGSMFLFRISSPWLNMAHVFYVLSLVLFGVGIYEGVEALKYDRELEKKKMKEERNSRMMREWAEVFMELSRTRSVHIPSLWAPSSSMWASSSTLFHEEIEKLASEPSPANPEFVFNPPIVFVEPPKDFRSPIADIEI